MLITLNEVTKHYRMGNTMVPALADVSLKIDKGEFIAVWGPSGSGKTTLLNIIGTIDEPTSGQVVFQERSTLQLTDNEKSDLRNKFIGFIFQSFNLIPVLSALENVMLPLQIQGLAAKDCREAARARLEQVGLAELLHNRPDNMSGGQQQRVSIARALVTNPAVVIADEPTANLDSENALKILELMRTLNRNEQTTFIFSTHDQRLLAKVDRRLNLKDGRLEREENR